MNLAEVSIKRPVFAAMMIMALMVFGLVSYPNVGVDLYPEVDFPVVSVTTIYPGADPETIEQDVSEHIEEAVSSVGGIDTLNSINKEGTSSVVIQFELEVDGDKALQEVREKISQIVPLLPDAAEPPQVAKFDIGAAPIMNLALSGDMPVTELTELADKVVKQRLQQIQGIGGIDLAGGRERQVQVVLDPARLRGHALVVGDVTSAIVSQNIEVPAGKFERGATEFSVKTDGTLRTAAEVADVLLPGDAGLRLGDVSRVVDGEEEAVSVSYLDGQPAISLSVRKQSGANTVTVAENVRKAIEDLKPEIEKRGASLVVATDNSVFIARSIHDVQFDLLFGALLAVFVIALFLMDLRATIISAVAIPTSVVATIAFIQVMGFTFNNMTMLALSLAIGILVDDAIVVIENIHRHMKRGISAMQAAKDATAEIFLPVLAMTSTVIAVFVPVAVMKGIVGRFFVQFGLTVSFAVAVSMFVSFTLTPMLSSRLLIQHNDKPGRFKRFIEGRLLALEDGYSRVVSWSLRHRLATLAFAAVALVGAGGLVTQVPAEFVPVEDRSAFSVEVEMPPGTSLPETNKAAQAIANDVRTNIPDVKLTLATSGGAPQWQPNQAAIQVELISAKKRVFSQQQAMAWVRERYSDAGEVKVRVSEAGTGGGNEAPVQIYIRGNDLDELASAGTALAERVRQVPGFVDVKTSFQTGRPEISLSVDRDRAAALNVPIASVATEIRALLGQDAVSEIKSGGKSYDIVVVLPQNVREEIEGLANLQVRSSRGDLVDLSNVVSVSRKLGLSQIDRQSRQRQVAVSANLDGLALGDATAKINTLAAEIVPEHLTVTQGGNAKMMEESFLYMVQALILAILLVYMILAAQFDSYLQPITIMVSMPLSVVGAFGALYLADMTLSIFSMIGVIMLMGLVTKNAILLVDFANMRRGDGLSIRDALVEAGRLRLRPILMTAFSMVFGMLPVAMAISEGGEARAPMAVCVIGGLITSTVLTLVVVPVIYTLIDSIGDGRLAKGVSSWLMPAQQGA